MERLRMELMPVGTKFQQVFINGVDMASNIKAGGVTVLGQDPIAKGVVVQVTFMVDDFRCISASAPGHVTETNARGADKDFDGCGYIATEMGADK